MMRPASAETFQFTGSKSTGYGRLRSRMNVCSLQVFCDPHVCLPFNPVLLEEHE